MCRLLTPLNHEMVTSQVSFQLDQLDPKVCVHKAAIPRLLVDHQQKVKSSNDPAGCLNK